MTSITEPQHATSSTIVERIGKLLAKAESTTSPAEAEALLGKAQWLATQHSVDLAVARRTQTRAAERETPTERVITVGVARQQNLKQLVELYSAIARANDIKLVIRTDSTVIYAGGFPSDLDVADALFASLADQMARTAARWLDQGEWRAETVDKVEWHVEVRGGRRWKVPTVVQAPMTKQTARRSFYSAFIATVGRRMADARHEALDTVESGLGDLVETFADRTDSRGKQLTSTALALRDKSSAVNDFHAQQVANRNARGTWRGSQQSRFSDAGHEAGRQAGQQAHLGGARSLPSGGAP